MPQRDCPDCDRTLSSYIGYSRHYIAKHGDTHPLVALVGEDELVGLYGLLSENEMSERYDVSRGAVKDALSECDVDRRGQSEAEKLKWEQMSEVEREQQVSPAHEALRVSRAEFRTNPNGYEQVRCQTNGEVWKVHRLVMVAEHGVEAVLGNHVHHKNGIKWDNRPSNLEVMSESGHLREEYEHREIGDDGRFEPVKFS